MLRLKLNYVEMKLNKMKWRPVVKHLVFSIGNTNLFFFPVVKQEVGAKIRGLVRKDCVEVREQTASAEFVPNVP